MHFSFELYNHYHFIQLINILYNIVYYIRLYLYLQGEG